MNRRWFLKLLGLAPAAAAVPASAADPYDAIGARHAGRVAAAMKRDVAAVSGKDLTETALEDMILDMHKAEDRAFVESLQGTIPLDEYLATYEISPYKYAMFVEDGRIGMRRAG